MACHVDYFMIPPSARARVEAGVAVLKAREGDVLEEIVWAMWQEMRRVKVPQGRPVYDERMFQSAVDLVRGGESLRSVRQRFGFGKGVAMRVRAAAREDT